MSVTVRSFAKINLGLYIGALRPDGFHDLRTVYQTIALHDIIRVQVVRGSGIEIRCDNSRVPCDQSNTCYKIIEYAMAALRTRGRVIVKIEKRLPVRGGLGGASANAVAALFALELAVKKELVGPEKLRFAAEVGSDLPLFLIGGTILGVSRGEEVYPLPDMPAVPCVIAMPEIGVSTPKAFAAWDRLMSCSANAPAREMNAHVASPGPRRGARKEGHTVKLQAKLTVSPPSDRMFEVSRTISAWLSGFQRKTGRALSGVPASGRGRAETLLLDLVRTGIENDFEKVVFPQYPELREVKRVLEKAGAVYASLSGSGSALYGLFSSRAAAQQAAARLKKSGIPAVATVTMTRQQYWKKIFD
jgi:4-diphosphocytidyl-2-C-methyl-D-erythritol kinase